MKVQKYVVIITMCIMAVTAITTGALFAGCDNLYQRLLADGEKSNKDNGGSTGGTSADDSGISVEVSPASLELRFMGDTAPALTATVLPSGTSQGVTWSTSNPAVATVAADGVVTAIGIGSAVITAASVADPSKTAACTRKVLSTAGN
jgi:uncharacterized protein YjdB